MDAERKRLEEDRTKTNHWRRWGGYLAERQWGTVREDYSLDGDAWSYFPYDHSFSRAYRWGEDGIGGVCDNHQRLCFAFAFWNGKDSTLKERLFGLSNHEGNHGEDVKENYYYLDATPTHSYLEYLYKYPQNAFPYEQLKSESCRRGPGQGEYELIDTGIFDQDDYFDIFIEYAKADPEDLLIRIRLVNRSKEKRELHLLPTLWLRNTWTWEKKKKEAEISLAAQGCLKAQEAKLGERYFYYKEQPEPLFTENESNLLKLYGEPNQSAYVKDAFHDYLICGRKEAVNPKLVGSKAALHYPLELEPGEERTLLFRLTTHADLKTPFAEFDAIFAKRHQEADDFYAELAKPGTNLERRSIQRQALAGLFWSKQFYHFVVDRWMEGDKQVLPPPEERKKGRNRGWVHLYNDDVLSVPDKWEFPWFASWDLAFHCIPLAIGDPEFAKRQLTLLTREWYMHPSGQIPAYEWNFSDVNPPVHAWATWRVYKIEQRKWGREDRHFLESMFQKLLLNFTWWVNRKDKEGKNVFEGGFLGLDNISVFNRSEDLPKDSSLIQADATSWMAMYCLNMWTIAMELAEKEPSYEDMASKFFEHFLYIADAIHTLWDDGDGFYYDQLQFTDGRKVPIKVRSMVGLLPLCAVATLEEDKLKRMTGFYKRFHWFLEHRVDMCDKNACMRTKGVGERHLFSLLRRDKLIRIVRTLLDETEFLSPYGLRSLSRHHKEHPYNFQADGRTFRAGYEPGEADSALFGGNSNWRGPIWFPLNTLIIEALQKFHHYYGDTLKVEFPTGSGKEINLWEVSMELSQRLVRLFESDPQTGKRPLYNGAKKQQMDPHFKDYLLFYEYFHGETGQGLGATHQTGWTALIAKIINQLI